MNIFAFVIGLVVVVLTMVFAFLLVIISESKKPRNKVSFFVAKDEFNNPVLILLDKVDGNIIALSDSFRRRYGLDPDDFADMKPMERKEVFLNLEN